MGARPDRSPGALVCCSSLRRVLAFVFLLCACLLMPMAATDGASLVGSANAAMTTTMAPGAPAQRPGGADAFRSSKRRIPKGPDPIHNRRAGKMTIEPRRRG